MARAVTRKTKQAHAFCFDNDGRLIYLQLWPTKYKSLQRTTPDRCKELGDLLVVKLIMVRVGGIKLFEEVSATGSAHCAAYHAVLVVLIACV